MAKRESGKSWVRLGTDPQPAAQEATPAREQATHIGEGPDTGRVKESKVERPPITLKDGSVVDAFLAVNEWNRLQRFADQPEFQSLVALAERRSCDADPGHFKELKGELFIRDDHSVDPITCALLLN